MPLQGVQQDDHRANAADAVGAVAGHAGFLAWLGVQKFVLLVPLDRIRRMLVSKGIDIPMPTLVRFIEKAATLLDPIDGEHWKQLKAGPTIQVDGTSLKVLVAGQCEAHNGYIDVFLRDTLTVFLFSMTKHSDGLLAALGDYGGRIVCDAESRMDALVADGNRLEANCNAHARRKFRDAEVPQPVLAKRASAFLILMYDLERRAKPSPATRCWHGASSGSDLWSPEKMAG